MKSLPTAQFPPPVESGSHHYVVTTADRRGRLADRSPLRVVGWSPGAPVSVRMRGGLILVTAEGPHAITSQGHLRLPLAVRLVCHIETGDRLLVAASYVDGAVTICRTDVLDAIMRRHLGSAGEEPRG